MKVYDLTPGPVRPHAILLPFFTNLLPFFINPRLLPPPPPPNVVICPCRPGSARGCAACGAGAAAAATDGDGTACCAASACAASACPRGAPAAAAAIVAKQYYQYAFCRVLINLSNMSRNEAIGTCSCWSQSQLKSDRRGPLSSLMHTRSGGHRQDHGWEWTEMNDLACASPVAQIGRAQIGEGSLAVGEAVLSTGRRSSRR